MWIRTQDKKELVNVIKVYISNLQIGKNSKVSILGDLATNRIFSSNTISLGQYPTMTEALHELHEIETSIINIPNSVYHMQDSK